MIRYRRLAFAVILALAPAQVLAVDIVACIVADGPNNGTYYGMATTVTRLKCEFTNKDYYPTLPELYRQGWRLIQVLGEDQASAQGVTGRSPLYLLERQGESQGAASTPTAANQPAPPKPVPPADPAPSQAAPAAPKKPQTKQ